VGRIVYRPPLAVLLRAMEGRKEGRNARAFPVLKVKAHGHGRGGYSSLQDRPIEVPLRPSVARHNPEFK